MTNLVNKNYGKLNEDGTIEYAPIKFFENNILIVPKKTDDEFYISRGWYIVQNEMPDYDPATQRCTFSEWRLHKESNSIIAMYFVEPLTGPKYKEVKRFSKLKITLFCMEQNIWKDVKEYLEKIGYYDLFVMAQYFLESDEYFIKGIESFKEAYCDANNTKEKLDDLIEAMYKFAEDGTEQVEVFENE